MLSTLFRKRPSERLGASLYAAAVAQARVPAFYTAMGVADRIDARFELYTLHVLLLVLRLRDEGEAGTEAGQLVFDTYVSSLDHALRELGVGDVSVAKKMRKLGEALYGRMSAYEGPIRAEDAAALAPHLARNVFESADAATGETLAAYVIRARRTLAGQPYAAVLKAPLWPEVGA